MIKILSSLVTSILLISCMNETPIIKATKAHKYPVSQLISANISDDGSVVALLSDKRLSVWNLATLQLQNEWPITYFIESQYYISLSKNKRVVASAGKNQVTIIDLYSGKTIASWKVKGFSEHAQISMIKLVDNAKQLFIGLNEGSIIWINLGSNKRSIVKVHEGAVKFLEYSKNGNFLLSGGLDGKVNILNLVNANIEQIAAARSRITCLTMDDQGSQFFYSDALNNQQLIDIKTGAVLSNFKYFERFKYFRKALFIKDDQMLVNSTSKNYLDFWDLSQGEIMGKATILSETLGSTTLDMAVDNKEQLITISSDGVVEFWPLDF